MIFHANLDLFLFTEMARYREIADRFPSWRCKHFHHHRIQPYEGEWRIEQFHPFFDAAGDRPIHGGALVAPNALHSWITSMAPIKAWETIKAWVWRIVSENPQITSWDVGNEIWPNGGTARNVPWVPSDLSDEDKLKLASRWLDELFVTAHEANPNAVLYLKDCRPQCRRWNRILSYAKGAIARGVPIHGISVQLHSNILPELPLHKVEDIFKAAQTLGLRLSCDETILWDTTAIRRLNSPYELLASVMFQHHQYAIYQKWIKLCDSYGVEKFGVWSPTDQPRDTWHWRNRPVWHDGQAYWDKRSLRDAGYDGDLVPITQRCSPGLWGQDWEPKRALELFDV